MTRTLLLLALLSACTSRPESSTVRQREQCLAISHSGDDLTRCLVVQHDWDAAPASLEGRIFQARIDTLTRIARNREATQDLVRVLADWESSTWIELRREGYDTTAANAVLKRVRHAAGHPPDRYVLDVASSGLTVIANMIAARFDTLSHCRPAVDSIYNVFEAPVREHEAVIAIVC
jgi:hypothetical protein